jgi:hypothetical protein
LIRFSATPFRSRNSPETGLEPNASTRASKFLWQLVAPRSKTSTPQAVPEGKDMNRIYQGKVTAVEIPDGKDFRKI